MVNIQLVNSQYYKNQVCDISPLSKKKFTYQPSPYVFDNKKNGNVTLQSKKYINILV